MLQQTTVSAVRKRYDTFLRRFPDVESLAQATEEEVLAAWSGLGYYARARNLRLAARAIVGEHGGVIPRAPSHLARLPGFGEYMAAAVASLAFGARVPAAEANVDRVLARVFALPGLAGSGQLRRRVLARAADLLPERRPGDLTAALMDLGQTICTPRRPACPVCPIASHCRARRRGDPGRFPRRRAKQSAVRLSLAAAVVQTSGRVLLVRRRSSWLNDLWEFPSAEGASAPAARRRLARRIGELGLELDSARPIGSARHTVVNRRIEISVFRARRGNGDRAPARGAARWFLARELDDAALPTLTRKIAAAGLRPGSG
ncbi:MAG TPA: NUDIX domain-containing protein [Thermoanaerobaculia bacterium]|nr:NUDIX domain-containing protein [Thermoanaerobaculia bacterium]